MGLTTGTGMDLTGLDQDPYLVSGRIGTPSDRNRIFGLSALYGEVIDEHGAHRVDERDPRGDFRELDGFVRRLRVGGDFTQIIGQFTLRSEISGGEDFEQSVFNALGEIDWTTSDEKLSAYLQLVYLGQDGHFGWDEDLETRLGFLWKIDNSWKLSGQWIHDFYTYSKEAGGVHFNDDIWSLQLRFTF